MDGLRLVEEDLDPGWAHVGALQPYSVSKERILRKTTQKRVERPQIKELEVHP
jgi:hypothetical protein